MPLAAGQSIVRSFTLTVPGDAGPGEYITSLILENDQPITAGDNANLNQIERQAVAIVVKVPGLRSPRLVIGRASHSVVAGASIVSVAVDNTGNVRLKPIVGFVLIDASGAEISRATIQMDTFYAKTSTFVEFPLPALLQPGTYTVDLTLADGAQDVTVEQRGIRLVVESAVGQSATEGVVPGLIDVTQGGGQGLLASVGVGLALELLLATAAVLMVCGRRRQRRKHPHLAPGLDSRGQA